ncbi:hypothetical protein C0J52_00602 [Blattella germanica]|nr:hypothetical protein C0J52_00602 [Blattella germanica]
MSNVAGRCWKKTLAPMPCLALTSAFNPDNLQKKAEFRYLRQKGLFGFTGYIKMVVEEGTKQQIEFKKKYTVFKIDNNYLIGLVNPRVSKDRTLGLVHGSGAAARSSSILRNKSNFPRPEEKKGNDRKVHSAIVACTKVGLRGRAEGEPVPASPYNGCEGPAAVSCFHHVEVFVTQVPNVRPQFFSIRQRLRSD